MFPMHCPMNSRAGGGNDTINIADSVDANALPILALAGSPLSTAIDWNLPLKHVLGTFAQQVSSVGLKWRGFSVVPATGGSGISWESTGQVVVAMQALQRL